MKFILEKFKIISKNIWAIWKKSDEDLILVHAASLTFSTFLNLIPLFALAYYFFDFLGGFELLQKNIEGFIAENLAPQFGDEILTYLEIIRQRISPKAMGAFGVFGFIISSILLLSKIEFSLNSMWNIKKTRAWTRKITTYWTIISLGPIFISVSVLASRKIYVLLEDSNNFFAIFLVTVFSVIPYFTSAIFLTAVYMWLPSVRINWRYALVGGVMASFMFEVLKQLYAFYATYAIKNSIYGTLAVLPVFMVWINLAWIVVLLGAQICYFLVQRPDKKTASIDKSSQPN